MVGDVPVLDYSGPSILALVAILVITRRLIWHKDLVNIEKDRDWWRSMALDLLGVTEKLTVQSEVTNELLTKIPEAGEESP